MKQHFDLWILILEDHPAIQEAMKAAMAAVESNLPEKKLRLRLRWIDHSDALVEQLQGQLFHFASLDLRVPKTVRGVLSPESNALPVFLNHKASAPLTAVTVMTQYAGEYLDAVQRAGLFHMELWHKALNTSDSKINAKPPSFTFPQWAQAIVQRLGDFGPAQAHAWNQASLRLPGVMGTHAAALSLCCENLVGENQRTILDAANYRNHKEKGRAALEGAFELAEQMQSWLWAVLASYLSVIAPTHIPASVAKVLRNGPIDKRPVEERRVDKEAQLGELCNACLHQSSGSNAVPLLLRQLGCDHDDPDASTFINALRLLREHRNTLVHQAKVLSVKEMWGEIAMPLRRLLNAIAYLCAYPVVTEVERQGLNQCRARRLVASGHSQGIEEWRIAQGMLGQSAPDEPADYQRAYALWPVAPGELGLLPLWPLVDLRYNATAKRTEGFLYAMRDQHKRPRDVNIDTLEWAALDNPSRTDALDLCARAAAN